MNETIDRFLAESALAEKIKLPARVVIKRTSLSSQDVVDIRAAGEYGPVPAGEEICELEIGGRRIATGKIVKKRGGYFFKVLELVDGMESGEVKA
jgi:hypothetical protein